MLNSVVNVMVKVVELGEVKEVKKDGETLRLRTVTLADKTGWVQPGGGGGLDNHTCMLYLLSQKCKPHRDCTGVILFSLLNTV